MSPASNPSPDRWTRARAFSREAFVRTWGEFRGNTTECILFVLTFQALAALVVVPLGHAVFGFLISDGESAVVSNEKLAVFFTSPWGLLVIVLSGAALVAFGFAERAGPVWIAGAELHEGDATAYAAIRAILRRAPRFVALGLWQVGITLLWLSPLLVIAGVGFVLLTGDLDLNYLVTTRPPAFWIGIALGAVLGLLGAGVVAFLRIRWAFSLPLLLFQGVGPRAALKESAALVKGRGRRIVSLFLAWWGGVFLLGLVAFELVFRLGDLAFPLVDSVVGIVVIAATLGLLQLAVAAATSFLLSTGEALLALRLYREATDVEPPASPGAAPPPRQARVKVAAGIAVVLVLAFGVAAFVGDLAAVDRTVAVTAHRGASGRTPENTLASLRAAIEDGADYAEIDVQESADGRIVVIHDTDLRRVSGRDDRIWATDLAELQRHDIGSWFAPEFSGERIATLEEAIEVVRDRLKLNIELKLNGHDVQLAERVVAIVEKAGFRDQCVVSSLDHGALRTVRKLSPEQRIGHIVFDAVGNLTALDVDFLAVRVAVATERLVSAAHARGMEVHVWTVNRADGMLAVIDLGVDNILTDEPALLRQVLRDREQLGQEAQILLAFRHWWSRR